MGEGPWALASRGPAGSRPRRSQRCSNSTVITLVLPRGRRPRLTAPERRGMHTLLRAKAAVIPAIPAGLTRRAADSRRFASLAADAHG